jgi:hypothetical protein
MVTVSKYTAGTGDHFEVTFKVPWTISVPNL